jgi:hypothetical protein
VAIFLTKDYHISVSRRDLMMPLLTNKILKLKWILASKAVKLFAASSSVQDSSLDVQANLRKFAACCNLPTPRLMMPGSSFFARG